jgi:hypothetical protein
MFDFVLSKIKLSFVVQSTSKQNLLVSLLSCQNNQGHERVGHFCLLSIKKALVEDLDEANVYVQVIEKITRVVIRVQFRFKQSMNIS